MGMDWLKGLVGPTANFDGQQQQYAPPYAQYGQYGQPGAPQPGAGGPPQGGFGQPAYAPQGAPPQAGPGAQPQWGPPPTYGNAAAFGAPGAQPQAAPQGAPPDARIAALEAKCDELRRDVESIALFARTLLTMLQEKQVVTPEQFQETKRKLDMLDGKLDDRMGV